ncbi:MAG: hypothetical protein JKY12_05360 [Sneathiella sp.]|nr:hypothetical protein [Sneathiella sp.]
MMRVYIGSMSDKPNISEVADAFFHLWQKQVSLLAQSPDDGFAHLLAEGEKLAAQFQSTDSEDGLNRDKTDIKSDR